ncbi:MAG: AMP-binding protein [Pirellulales bacterium]|nr:AMP-binding protein [Pirellulales bacterium]
MPNVAARLAEMARLQPDAVAVAEPAGHDAQGRGRYRRATFGQLDADSDRLAGALIHDLAVPRGARLALLVRPGIDFVSLMFALLKAGMVTVLIDPGMGRRNLARCLEQVEPEGFIGVSVVHAARVVLRGRFPLARYNVTVGRRWFWGGPTLAQLRRAPDRGPQLAAVEPDEPAAIIFTTGSTGPAKGVLYTHQTFDSQVVQIRDFYGIEPGGIDLPGFPMFGLFNSAMGVTSVIPDMDPTRPAGVDPVKIVDAARQWGITQMFGSPAMLNRIGRYCEEQKVRIDTLRRVLSCGAPVPVHVLRRMKAAIHPDGDIHTPYGATEALPVASIGAGEVLRETAARTGEGAGTCVGRRFPGVEWRVIRIVDGPIGSIDQCEPLPASQIGELIVRGPAVTRQYVNRPEADALAKIRDGSTIWHRMGDAGYLDLQDRFWFCGRVAHRVLTAAGPMYTVPCEAIFNRHEAIYRSALVGVGTPGSQRPVVVLEPAAGLMPRTPAARRLLLAEICELGQTSPLTRPIDTFLLHPSLPVDIRHNAKIFREKLSVWAAKRLASRTTPK